MFEYFELRHNRSKRPTQGTDSVGQNQRSNRSRLLDRARIFLSENSDPNLVKMDDFIQFLRDLSKLESFRKELDGLIEERFDTLITLLNKAISEETVLKLDVLSGAFVLYVQLRKSLKNKKRTSELSGTESASKRSNLKNNHQHTTLDQFDRDSCLSSLECSLVQRITVQTELSQHRARERIIKQRMIDALYSFRCFYLEALNARNRDMLVDSFSLLVDALLELDYLEPELFRVLARGSRFLFYRYPSEKAQEMIRKVTVTIFEKVLELPVEDLHKRHIEGLCAFISYHREFWEPDNCKLYELEFNQEFVLKAVERLSQNRQELISKQVLDCGHALMLLSLSKLIFGKGLPVTQDTAKLLENIRNIVTDVLTSRDKSQSRHYRLAELARKYGIYSPQLPLQEL